MNVPRPFSLLYFLIYFLPSVPNIIMVDTRFHTPEAYPEERDEYRPE